MADYFVCKKQRVDVADLYSGEGGRYHYKTGWNKCAMIAWIVSFILPILGNTVFSYKSGSGTAPNLIQMIAANGYIFSFVVAFIVYVALMNSGFGGSKAQKGYVTEEEHKEFSKE